MSEEWRAVVGYEGIYEVSSLGDVRSLPRTFESKNRWGPMTVSIEGKVLKPRWSMHYQVFSLKKDGVARTTYLHHIVLNAFAGPCPTGLECRHKDGNSSNAKRDNLEWATHVVNCHDRFEHNTISGGGKRLTAEVAKAILADKRSAAKIMAAYNVSHMTVWAIQKRRTWKHLTP